MADNEVTSTNFNVRGFLDVRLDSVWAELSHYISAEEYNLLKADIVRVAKARGITIAQNIIPSDIQSGKTVTVDDLVKLRAMTKNTVLYDGGKNVNGKLESDVYINNKTTTTIITSIKTTKPKGKISINKGSIKELTTLTGIGEAKAKKIIEYREKNGPFAKIEDIKKVNGIGDSIFAKIKDSITL